MDSRAIYTVVKADKLMGLVEPERKGSFKIVNGRSIERKFGIVIEPTKGGA